MSKQCRLENKLYFYKIDILSDWQKARIFSKHLALIL